MFTHPVPGPITSPYGPRKIGFHNGQDYGWLLADPDGSKHIYSPATGVVSVGWNVLVGNYVLIATSTVTIRLAHLASVAVKTGQTVTQGKTFIGVMGRTGAQTFGIHLHVDVYQNGSRVNPAPYFTIPFGTPTDSVERTPDMPILVSLVQGNPPKSVGDYAVIGDGGVVGLRAKEDADLINTCKRAMWDREPVYGAQADQLAALFARVAVKADIDYTRLASEVAKLVKVPTASENGAAARAAIVKP